MATPLRETLADQIREFGPPETLEDLELRYPITGRIDPELGDPGDLDEQEDWGDEEDWQLEAAKDAERDRRIARREEDARARELRGPRETEGFVPKDAIPSELLSIRPRPTRAGNFSITTNFMDLGPDIRLAPYLPSVRRIRITPQNSLAGSLVVHGTDLPSRKFYAVHRSSAAKHFEEPRTVVVVDQNGELYRYALTFDLEDGTSMPMDRALFEREIAYQSGFNRNVGFYDVEITDGVLETIAQTTQRITEDVLALSDEYLQEILAEMAERYPNLGEFIGQLGTICSVSLLFPDRSFSTKLRYETFTPTAVAGITMVEALSDISMTREIAQKVFSQGEIFAAEFADMILRTQNPTVRTQTHTVRNLAIAPFTDFVPLDCRRRSKIDTLDMVFVNGQCHDLRRIMEAYLAGLPDPYTHRPFTKSMKAVLANYRAEKYEDAFAFAHEDLDAPVAPPARPPRRRLYDYVVGWLDRKLSGKKSNRTLACNYCKKAFGKHNPISSVRKNKLVQFCDEKCFDESPWE